MNVSTFKLLQSPASAPSLLPGTVVYEYTGHTYGLVSDDEEETGIEHTAITLDPTGAHPFFTCPVEYLEPIKQEEAVA